MKHFRILYVVFVMWIGCCALFDSALAVENVLRPRPAAPRKKNSSQLNPRQSPAVADLLEASEEYDATAVSFTDDPPPEFLPIPMEQESEFEIANLGKGHHIVEDCEPTPLEILWWQRFKHAFQGYRDPNDPSRHFGVGDPLVGTSWRNRPWYVNGFAGGLIGDDLQSGLISQGGGFIAGGRFGGDFDHYWGAEIRLAFANLDLDYKGLAASGQSRDAFFDANLLYYPLGDTRWRPYLTAGLGVASFSYDDATGQQIRGSAVELPFGGGLKYYLGRQWALRFDLIDNFTLASGNKIDLMHNVSFTGGLEIHFGGKYVQYGPW